MNDSPKDVISLVTDRIKHQRWLAYIIIAGAGIVAIGQFVSAVDAILSFAGMKDEQIVMPMVAHSGELTPFAIQLGAFNDQENAQKLLEKLNTKGHSAYMDVTLKSTGSEWFRIKVGPFPSRLAAANIRKKFELDGMKPFIVDANDKQREPNAIEIQRQ